MPLFLVKERSYINERLVEAGTIIDYTPPKALQKPPADATLEEKALPHYKDTRISDNLVPAPPNSVPHEIPTETVSRTI